MPHLTTAERVGRRIGRKEGREEGQLEEARSLLLRLGEIRLGAPGKELHARVTAITDRRLVETLCERVLGVETWDDLLNCE